MADTPPISRLTGCQTAHSVTRGQGDLDRGNLRGTGKQTRAAFVKWPSEDRLGAFAIPLRHVYIWPHHGASLMPQQSGLSSLITELKRRRVFRVAAVYGGVAFVVIELVDGTFELKGTPSGASMRWA